MRILLINGPPQSGKDTTAEIILKLIPKAVHLKFATEVKRRVHRALDLDYADEAHYELWKEEPLTEFHGCTPRQTYIQFSEHFCKPLFGRAVFGQWALQHMMDRTTKNTPLVVFSDSGFREEAMIFWKEFGKAVSLVRLFREGCTFDNDSRSYWNPPEDMHEFSVFNNGRIEDLTRMLETTVLPSVLGKAVS